MSFTALSLCGCASTPIIKPQPPLPAPSSACQQQAASEKEPIIRYFSPTDRRYIHSDLKAWVLVSFDIDNHKITRLRLLDASPDWDIGQEALADLQKAELNPAYNNTQDCLAIVNYPLHIPSADCAAEYNNLRTKLLPAKCR